MNWYLEHAWLAAWRTEIANYRKLHQNNAVEKRRWLAAGRQLNSLEEKLRTAQGMESRYIAVARSANYSEKDRTDGLYYLTTAIAHYQKQKGAFLGTYAR